MIPVYNEEATIEELLNLFMVALYRKEVIIFDDGSADNTCIVLDKTNRPDVNVCPHKKIALFAEPYIPPLRLPPVSGQGAYRVLYFWH